MQICDVAGTHPPSFFGISLILVMLMFDVEFVVMLETPSLLLDQFDTHKNQFNAEKCKCGICGGACCWTS